MAERKKVLIIGGGFTGLTAAYELSKDPQFSITLLERSEHLGGLAGGFPLLGTFLEKTYHHLFRTDSAILTLVEELGLADQLIWCKSSMGILRDGRVYPFVTPWDLLRFKPCGLVGRVRVGFTALYLKWRRNWKGLVGQSAVRWMTRACGKSAMETIWTPLLKGKFERFYDSIAMAWLWARIHARANTRQSGGSREQLGYFRGGFTTVVKRLESEVLRRGVEIRTGMEVEAFLEEERFSAGDRGGDRPSPVLSVKDRRQGRAISLKGGERIAFDVCLFTGPSPAFAQLLPPRYQDGEYARKLRSVDYLGAINLVFVTDQDISDYYWLNINEAEAPFLVFLNHTKLVDPAWYQGKQVYYIGVYASPEGRLFSMGDEELTKLWFGYLHNIFPAFDETRVQHRFVFRFKSAQHIVDTQYENKIPAYETSLPGVFLCNFSQIFPHDRGTTWAVSEGMKLAHLIREHRTE